MFHLTPGSMMNLGKARLGGVLAFNVSMVGDVMSAANSAMALP
ncbi:MAG: hypothetical protein O7C67_00985 [Gammaproteobacteria bacterium]|nr:hypothetical protein [Gammaproteobacteria bacterium]